MSTNPEWAYESSQGVACTGYVCKVLDHGGTDITYIMRRVTPNETQDLLSGDRLRKARTTGRAIPLTKADQTLFDANAAKAKGGDNG